MKTPWPSGRVKVRDCRQGQDPGCSGRRNVLSFFPQYGAIDRRQAGVVAEVVRGMSCPFQPQMPARESKWQMKRNRSAALDGKREASRVYSGKD